MIKLIGILFFSIPMISFGQGTVEVDYGRTIEVQLYDTTKPLEDFVINNCCVDWKWGSNRILILGQKDKSVYAVTSSSVKDGSDEEVELNLLCTEFNGTTTTINLFKNDSDSVQDTIAWKKTVIEKLKENENDLTDLKPLVVLIGDGNDSWVAKVWDQKKENSISWIFETDTSRGHDYYFNWKVLVEKITQKK